MFSPVTRRSQIANWLMWFLFYVQPGVDRGALCIWIGDTFFPSQRLFMTITTASMYVVNWFVVIAALFALYRLQIPYIEQFRIQPVWLWLHPDPKKRDSAISLTNRAMKKFISDHVFLFFVLCAITQYVTRNADEAEMKAYFMRIPPWYVTIGKLGVGILMFETVFYWAHRAQHEVSGFYKHHKIHHDFKQPLALTGGWGSVMDAVASTTLPGIVPIFFLDLHVYELWMWVTIHVYHSVYDHCGYDFPFSPLQLIPFSGYAAAHNFHHTHIMGNFGLYFQFWDEWMGTNKSWLKFESLTEKERLKEISERAYVVSDDVVVDDANIKQPNQSSPVSSNGHSN